jgi:hypothetical protein
MRKSPVRLVIVILVLAGMLACQLPFDKQPEPTSPPTAEPLPPTPPLLIDRAPARGEEATLERSLTLTFDQPMDQTSVERAFSIEPQVAGDVVWEDPTTLVFTPRSSWERATRYQVKVEPAAKSAEGLPLREGIDFTFATVGYLEVTQVMPEPDTEDIEPDSRITVMFNRPVVPLQVVSVPDDELPDPLRFDPPVAGSGEWLNTSIYVFEPAEGFVPGQTYQATVEAGLTDTTGGVLEEDFTWSFTIQAPYVVWTNPDSGQDLIPLTRPVTVTFSQPMDQDATEEAFSLQDAEERPVAGSFSWNDEGDVMTFRPEEMLELGTRYTAMVANSARAAVGAATLREAERWFFHTVPYPSIVETEPFHRQTDVDPDLSFEIYFSAPMDVSTLMDQITILPEPTDLYTYWVSHDNRLVLDWDMEPSTSYEVRLGDRMADPYGNRIDETQIVRYTTAPLPPLTYLAVPGDVGTYNAYTDTQVFVLHRNVSRVDLALYSLSWGDFERLTGRDRWSAWDNFEPDRGDDLIREWSIPVQAPLNETDFLNVKLAEDGGSLEPGLYFLEVSGPEMREVQWWEPARHILVVSRLHLTMKLAQQEALVWATDLQTGEPVEDLDVDVSFLGSITLVNGPTDDEGVFQGQFPPIDDMWASYFAISGEQGEETFGVVHNRWLNGIAPWNFDLPSSFSADPYRVYLYTDRPIYRPGQPVYFRGIVRAEDDVQYSLPQSVDTLAVVVYDDQGEEIYNADLTLSEFGTFAGEFTLDEEAGLGYYTIEVQLGDQYEGLGFQVAEYRRPEFQVQVTTDREALLLGETFNAEVEATYFFGGPVADARVRWTLSAQEHFFRPNVPGRWSWRDIDLDDYRWWRMDESSGWDYVVADGEGTTDAQGRFVFSVPAEVADATASQRLTLEATVIDVSDQSVSNRTSLVAHRGLFYIGLQPERYVGYAGEEQVVDLLTVDWEGEPVGEVELQVTFSRREWLNVQEQGPGGSLRWTWVPTETLVFSQTVMTDEDGEAQASFVPEQAGAYVVRAEGADAEGNTITSATRLWVSGRQYVSWRQENNDRIQLIADRRSYAPGDVARILIPSPFQGEVTALVTVERGGILEHRVQTLQGNAETIELEITEDYIPNVYVSVVLVKGVDETHPLPGYRVGYVSFDVSSEARALNIEITPDRPMEEGEHYSPRETVQAEIRVTDPDGQPVEAEVGLAVVDEAVLSLAPPNAPPILEGFYGERGLGVRTAAGLSLAVDRITAEVAREAKGGGGGGPEMALGAQMIRQDFPDTALWEPSVRTGPDGRAEVEFSLPDQLTTWNVEARAVTQETLVGQTEVDILSTKDLLVRPVTPRFFVVGDRADLAAVVNNNTDRELEVEVWLEAEGLSLEGERRHTVTLPAGGKARVEWPVTVGEAQWADLTFYAEGGGYSDAVKPPAGLPPEQNLPIYRYSSPETVGTAGQLEDEESVLEAILVPGGVDASQGGVQVRIEPSLAAGMRGGLDYLEHYPYECTEQVVSRFLPNVLTYRALVELGLEDEELERNLMKQVTMGLQRLYARQHYNGGWGWWLQDESNELVTAYVLLGLVKVDEAGFEVEEGVIERGVDFLLDRAPRSDDLENTWEANRWAFIFYVLAEAGEVEESHLVRLYEQREQLAHYGRAYLALAFGLLDEEDPRIGTLLSDLNNAAIVSATGAHWQEAERGWWNWNTDTRSTAIVLDALVRLDPDNELIPNTVRWLMRARTADHWETTQETAWALIALTDWMVVSGELEGRYDWEVRVNGEELGSGRVTPETVREVEEMWVSMADLLVGEVNRLEIGRGEGPGRLYYTAHLNAYLPVEEVQALNRGIVVGRVYEPVDCTEDCTSITQAQVGERVRVRLTLVVPNDLHYVVVEDPFPAGAEPVDTSLQTTSTVGEQPDMRRVDEELPWWWYYGWGWWWFSNTDLRDEKLVLFATYLPAGTYEYTYVLQMGLAGEYRVLPVHAYEMYFPEVMGRSDGALFTIER